MKEIVFTKSRICEVKHNLGKVSGSGTVPSVIKVVAIMTSEIASSIGCRWLLFDKEKDVKNGFAEVVLDQELANLRVKFEAPKIDGLDMYVDRVTKFKVYSKGDGKKKAKRLMVSFLVHQVGSPFHLLEYPLKVGGVEGTCTLQARQEELQFSSADTDKITTRLYEVDAWTARIEVKEMPGGMFSMTRRATAPKKKFAQGPPVEFASEVQALQAGAIQIQDWLMKLRLTAKGDKAERTKVIDWCAQYVAPQMPLDGKMAAAGERFQ